MNGIRKAANKETIADLGKTVAEYFKDQYEVELKYPNLQLLWVLIKFHDENKGRKLEKIVMYRDGVSEGHVLAVLAGAGGDARGLPGAGDHLHRRAEAPQHQVLPRGQQQVQERQRAGRHGGGTVVDHI